MARITKQIWLQEGLQILTESGVEGLRIDTLCIRLAVTKGSFYHHFKNRRVYLEAILQFWEDKYTSKYIEHSEIGKTPFEKIRRLTELSINVANESSDASSHGEVSIRAWALHDPMARAYQERIDKRRIDYVQKLYFELSGDEEKARIIAHIIYTSLIGSQHLVPHLTQDEMSRVYKMLEKFASLTD